MARPWQLDITWKCPHCTRTMDVTVELRHPWVLGDPKATCPYCNAVAIQERAPGVIISIGKRE